MSEWIKTVNLLKKKLPADMPVKVRIVKKIPGGHRALCERKETHYLIRIEKAVPLEWKYWLLCHEYSHVMDSWTVNDDDHHSGSFAAWYHICYKTIFEEC